MSNQKNTKRGYIPNNGGPHIFGVDEFRKSLERDFFADSEITLKKDRDGHTTNLIVNLYCNFGLTESLFQLNNGNWGGVLPENQEIPKFERAIQKLSEHNHNEVDLAELSINFKDSSLIITKIYPRSISDYLSAILPAISANFVHFTKGMTEMPFEIFIPVFVEQTMTIGSSGANYRKLHNIAKGYFDYWGLYFESNADKDASIYDVRNKNIIEGDFFFLDY